MLGFLSVIVYLGNVPQFLRQKHLSTENDNPSLYLLIYFNPFL